MAAGFAANIVTGDNYVVVSMVGELDLAEGPTLRNTLERAISAGTRLVVADATDLMFLDSSGIGILVAAHKAQSATGGTFVVANLNVSVGKPVRLTEVDTAVPVHWAEPPATPWSDDGATAESIVLALGFDESARPLLRAEAKSRS